VRSSISQNFSKIPIVATAPIWIPLHIFFAPKKIFVIQKSRIRSIFLQNSNINFLY